MDAEITDPKLIKTIHEGEAIIGLIPERIALPEIRSGEWMGALQRIYDEGCTCTNAQQQGSDDLTVCRSCEAGATLNEIAEIGREVLRKLSAPSRTRSATPTEGERQSELK